MQQTQEFQFIDIRIGKNGQIQICIDACESAGKRPELAKSQIDLFVFEEIEATEFPEGSLQHLDLIFKSLLSLLIIDIGIILSNIDQTLIDLDLAFTRPHTHSQSLLQLLDQTSLQHLTFFFEVAEVILNIVDYLAVNSFLKTSSEEPLIVFLHFLVCILTFQDFDHLLLLQIAVPYQKLTSELHEVDTAFQVGQVLEPLICGAIFLFGDGFPQLDEVPLSYESDIVEHVVDPINKIQLLPEAFGRIVVCVTLPIVISQRILKDRISSDLHPELLVNQLLELSFEALFAVFLFIGLFQFDENAFVFLAGVGTTHDLDYN